MPATVYTPTKRNLAHAAAKDLRAALADAARAGAAASAQSTADIAEAAGTTEGEIERYLNASALDLEDLMHLSLALDAAGFTAVSNAVGTAFGEFAPA